MLGWAPQAAAVAAAVVERRERAATWAGAAGAGGASVVAAVGGARTSAGGGRKAGRGGMAAGGADGVHGRTVLPNGRRVQGWKVGGFGGGGDVAWRWEKRSAHAAVHLVRGGGARPHVRLKTPCFRGCFDSHCLVAGPEAALF